METAVQGFIRPPLHDSTTVHEARATGLNKEENRLLTFDSWPLAYIQPGELARWGFYYVGSGDVARCYFCNIELGSWEATDVVSHEHLKWSRHCPLMRKRPTTNVPLDPNFLNQLVDVVPDVTGAVEQAEWYIGETSGRSEVHQNIAPVANQTDLQPDSVPVYHPNFPSYRVETARLLSFKDWPKSMKQTPEQMADAGFFYTGKSDIVRCFCCGGALKDWLSEDDPWTEHAANFSGCHYVNLIKSNEFIRQCQKEMRAKEAEAHVPAHNGASEDEVTDDKSCKLCYSRPYDTVFTPCGHVVACGKCASSVTRCPLCNDQYTNIVRIYLP